MRIDRRRHILRNETPCAICNEPVDWRTARTNEDGQAVHEECYVNKVASENPCHPDQGTADTDWRLLAEQAARETDPQRLLELTRRLNEVLDPGRNQKKESSTSNRAQARDRA